MAFYFLLTVEQARSELEMAIARSTACMAAHDHVHFPEPPFGLKPSTAC